MKNMAHFILVMITFTGVCIEAQQSADSIKRQPNRFYFGYKAGFSFASFKGANASGLKSRPGFAIGVFAQYDITSVISIQPEILYSMKGAREEGIYNSKPYKGTYKLDYLEIPILLKFNMPTYSQAGPFIIGGVATGVKIHSKLELESEGSSTEVSWRGIENIDLGVVAGLGVNFSFPQGLLGFESRYTQGVILINKAGNDAEVRNSCIAVTVSYGF